MKHVPCNSVGRGPLGDGQVSPDTTLRALGPARLLGPAPPRPRAPLPFAAPARHPLAGGSRCRDYSHMLSPVSPPSKLLTPGVVLGPPDTGVHSKDKSICLDTTKSNQIFKILLDK